MVIANFKNKVQGDTMSPVLIRLNVSTAGCSYKFQLRNQYTDVLLKEATTSNSGITVVDEFTLQIEPFPLTFPHGQHKWELERTNAAAAVRTIARGVLPIIKEIVR